MSELAKDFFTGQKLNESIQTDRKEQLKER